ncbi:MAG: hypothetical protein U0T73_08620 [Chitinophagales bacterium]
MKTQTFRRHKRKFALFFLGLEVVQIFMPLQTLALTSGPKQPEFAGFEPVGTTEMVDPGSGDFNYNIPLIDVDGYPLNLSYKGGSSMEQEATWVGLGWSLAPGAINRTKRGVPDDFKGDVTEVHRYTKPNITVGVGGGGDIELCGFLGLSAGGGLFFNNYKGPGYETNAGINVSKGNSLSAGLTASFNSQSGLDLGISLGLKEDGAKLGLGLGMNSRRGLKALSFDVSKTITSAGGATPMSGSLGTASAGGSYSFQGPTYTPGTKLKTTDVSVNLHVKLGADIMVFNGSGSIKGYFTMQKVDNKVDMEHHYGTLYSQYATNAEDVLDFNREKDIPVKKQTKMLPLTFGTFDLFAAEGNGVGGQYRVFRNDNGPFFDPYRKSQSIGIDGGFELSVGIPIGGPAFGSYVRIGGEGNGDRSETETKKWVTENGCENLTKYKDYANDNLYEPAYMKDASEQVPLRNAAFYNNTVNTGPTSPQLNDDNQSSFPAGFLSQSRDDRSVRNSVMSYMTAEEADKVGLEKQLHNYTPGVISYGDCNPQQIASMPRVSGPRKAHHFSEMSITQNDGRRFVFGLPIYNLKEKDVSFRINRFQNGTPVDLIDYVPGQDNTTDNNRLVDHYFNSQETPAYATAFLLTGVLSPDYVDLTGDGISDDDLGSAHKFNYSKVSDFKWRAPIEENKASYQEGWNSKALDQTANYSYGEKEQWYMHSIESKDFVAVFYLEDREDGLAVKGENGGVDNSCTRPKCLKKISLFAKSELKANGANAVPIKEVHFEYDYSLCPGTPNAYNFANNPNKGKLTLKKVYFTYGKSNKGKLSAYKFDYKNASVPYDRKNCDRWGNYQNIVTGNFPFHSIFPYTIQNATERNNDAGTWCLNQITIPSGGLITVDYEADDYAYVQNKRAGQMFTVEGFGSSENGTGSTSIDGQYVYVKLPSAVADKNELSRRYFADLEGQLYFNCFVHIDPTTTANTYERVKGYATIEDFGFRNGTHDHVWIRLHKVKNLNPIQLAALQTLRLELEHLAYPGSNIYEEAQNAADNGDAGDAALSIIKGMFAIIGEIQNLLTGFNNASLMRGKCRKVHGDMWQSWIRLSNPDGKKKGGGERVKKVALKDNWSAMVASESDASYGQEYSYTTKDEFGNEISSGVAQWEPTVGNEELLQHLPITVEEEVMLAPNNFYFTEKPYGESLYPSASVTYSEVKVESIGNAGHNRTGTGSTVHKFYTARDFPTISKNTGIKLNPPPQFSFPNPFNILFGQTMAAVQGFYVEVNDMHGKKKSEELFSQNGSLVKGTYYEYAVKNPSAPNKELDNEVSVVSKDGTISKALMGIDYDVWHDYRQEETKVVSAGLSVNVEIDYVPFGIPIVFPWLWPTISTDKRDFQSATTTKFVKKMGVLKKVRVIDNGSSIDTENKIYDAETGQVLLTRTTNEFKDDIYNFTYPAHWAYDGMAQAYKNISARFGTHTGYTVANGVIPGTIAPFFVEGDEVMVKANGGAVSSDKSWVVSPNGSNKILVDASGNPVNYNTPVALSIIRSGRRNQAQTPIAQLATRADAKANPNPVVGNISSLMNTDIIKTGATQFDDTWRTTCKLMQVQSSDSKCDTITCDVGYAAFLQRLFKSNYLFANASQGVTLNDIINTPFTPTTLPLCQESNPAWPWGSSTNSNISTFQTWLLNHGFNLNELFVFDQIIPYGSAPNHYEILEYRANIGHGYRFSILLTSCEDANLPRANPVQEMFTAALQNIGNNPGGVPSAPGCELYLKEYCYSMHSNPLKFCEEFDRNFNNPDQSNVTAFIPGYKAQLGNNGEYYCSEAATCINGQMLWLYIPAYFIRCSSKPSVACKNLALDRPINPYAVGIRGNWRQKKAFTYYTDRNNIQAPNQTNIRKDGKIDNYNPFWTYNASAQKWVSNTTDPKWVWTNEMTNYDHKGNEVENKNALGQFSAALFGYNRSLNTAVGFNARYRQLAFDGFEDYAFRQNCTALPCEIDHWKFLDAHLAGQQGAGNAVISTEQSHSGRYSLKLSGNSNISNSYPIEDNSGALIEADASGSKYLLRKGGCLPLFSPDPDQKYVLSGWAKETRDCNDHSALQCSVDVIIDGNAQSFTFTPNAVQVEGWTRFEWEFTIPPGATNISVKLKSGSNVAFFDDLRIFPYNGNMKSFVYDPVNLRLMATLDENNFATFYEYDDDGTLQRVKKETQRGVVTLKETRSNFKPNNP